MVIHDEETLEEALLLVDSGPVRFNDRYMYVIISSRETLEGRLHIVLGRGEIAIVVPQGMESEMEDYTTEFRRVKERRQREEKKAIREYFHEHPESVENVAKHARKRGELGKDA